MSVSPRPRPSVWRAAPAALAVALGLASPAVSFPAVWPSSAGGAGLLDVRTAEGLSHGALAVQAHASRYSQSAGSVSGDPGEHQVVDGALQVAVGIGQWMEWWVAARGIYHDTSGKDVETLLGDGRAGVKFFLPRPVASVRAGLLLEVNVPVGDRAAGASTDTVDPAVTALLTVPLPLTGDEVRMRVHLNAGYRDHGDDRGRTFEGFPLYYLEPVYPSGQNDRIDLRGAIEVSGYGSSLFMEFVLDRLRHEGVAYSESPRFFNAGFRRPLTQSTSVLVAARVSLVSDDVSTTDFAFADDLYPDWQLGLALAWARRSERQ